jgi:hypothetical protein
MLVALLLEAPAAIYPPILSRGEGLYFAGTGMAVSILLADVGSDLGPRLED